MWEHPDLPAGTAVTVKVMSHYRQDIKIKRIDSMAHENIKKLTFRSLKEMQQAMLKDFLQSEYQLHHRRRLKTHMKGRDYSTVYWLLFLNFKEA
jgi:NAD kinase